MKLRLLSECEQKYVSLNFSIQKEDIKEVYDNDNYYSLYLNLDLYPHTYGYINDLLSYNTNHDHSASRYFLYFELIPRGIVMPVCVLNWSGEFENGTYSEVIIDAEITEEERTMLLNECLTE